MPGHRAVLKKTVLDGAKHKPQHGRPAAEQQLPAHTAVQRAAENRNTPCEGQPDLKKTGHQKAQRRGKGRKHAVQKAEHACKEEQPCSDAKVARSVRP